MTKVEWMHALLRDPIYKEIKKTAEDVKMIDSYQKEEAWKYAINQRKYLFETVLKQYDPPEISAIDRKDKERRRTRSRNCK